VAERGPEAKLEKFGRYLLLDRIGAGGMAEVFRAIVPGAEGFRRTFVVKRILAERVQTPGFVEMFVQEARICALLNHPGIVQVFDFGTVDGNYFLAMEYLRGRDLQALRRKLRDAGRPCPLPVAAYIAHQVALSLGYAHALRDADGKPLHVVHRDVSPSNIMCLRAGGVKLLDFGVAKALGDGLSENTADGKLKGKLSYVSPEQLRGEGVDGRSDLFALGIVLWELLTGQRLFRGQNEVETLHNVMEMRIAPPSSVRPDVPSALDFVVMRALERDPATRYATGEAMAEELEDVLAGSRYQARMLPALLHELFGEGLGASHGALPAVPPELLASFSSEPGTGAAAARSRPSLTAILGPGSRRRRILAASAGISWTVALAMLMFGRGGGGRSQATTLSVSTTPAATASAPVAASPSAPSAPSAPAEPTEPTAAAAPYPLIGDGAPEAAAPAPAARPARAHRDARGTRGGAAKARIARGLSIDPFAEAGKHGGGR
jgi:serine/threonine protein kinase